MEISIDELRAAAEAFLRSALGVLQEQGLFPPPVFHPYMRLGRDYFGPDLAGPELEALERTIARAHSRFSDETPLMERDFPANYAFSFLEAYIARSSLGDGPLSARGAAFDESLADLADAIGADTWEVACCRMVSHLTTVDGLPLDVAGVRLVPLVAPAHGRSLEAHEVIASVIAGAASAYAREEPFAFGPPESVVVAREVADKPFDVIGQVSGRIDRFLLLARLLHAGTSESIYEIQGETSLVRRFSPTLARFRGTGGGLLSMGLIRRTTRIAVDDHDRIESLWQLMSLAERERPEMVMTSFGMAIHKFGVSYHSHVWWEQLVDLATAFEAVLSGSDKTDVVLRLKTRAAALLATERDPASDIFKDVGQIYNLRSRLVHGGELKQKDLSKMVFAISTVPDTAPFGVALAHVVDRLRDLVRRGLLARICLAADEGDASTWSLGRDDGVDANLADDVTRTEWRSRWHDRLDSFGAAEAADRPREAGTFYSRDADD